MSDSKDSEIRARVTPEMYQALCDIAAGRGEQLPVIVREALAEYLAQRAQKDQAVIDALHDRPDVVRALLKIADTLKGTTYRKGKPSSPVSGKDTEGKIVDALKKDLAQEKAERSRQRGHK
jgi:hypothetical protein